MRGGHIWLVAGFATGLTAAPEPPSEDMTPILRLLDTPVETASRGIRHKKSDAPAIVSVISGEEIRLMGFTSVAEALQGIPGLYAIDDLVAPNLGVRGISGGLRAYSRILKVMINGQPVAFRSDTTNFLGPELIPLGSVERIEVVRGPASSLYGANAFLGVVNIVTRQPLGWNTSALLQIRGGPGGSFGADLVGSTSGDQWGLLVGATGENADRSGRHLPASSPILLSNPNLSTVSSRDDLSRPRSLLLNGHYATNGGIRLDLLGHLSRLDSRAEFLDFGTLSHANRISLDNRFIRFQASGDAGRRLSLMASLAFAKGAPSPLERLNSGSTTTHPRRDLGYQGADFLVEGKYFLRARDSLTAGADVSTEHQRLMTVYTVNNVTGAATVAGPVQGQKTFANVGLYAQYLWHPLDHTAVALNLRKDRHSIYEPKSTFRVGLVRQFTRTFYGKLLLGTSYKAPSALQLYAQPLFGGENLGNPTLRPESAKTLEAELGWSSGRHFAASMNLFRTKVRDKVELVPSGPNQIPTNTGLEDSFGAEAEAMAAVGRHRFSAALGYQRTEVHSPDPFRGELVTSTSLFPRLTAYGLWQYRYARESVTGISARYTSARRATPSNILENVSRPYALPPYTLVDAFWTHTLLREHGGNIRIQGRVRNLFDRAHAEPGFLGVDLPGARREFHLGVAFHD